eukprot:5026940-Pleurochrysis_carterae.AAC.1
MAFAACGYSRREKNRRRRRARRAYSRKLPGGESIVVARPLCLAATETGSEELAAQCKGEDLDA